MGMSASQARLLSLTARMHDLEFQAQDIQYSKLDLVDLKNNIYDDYIEKLDSTKIQMSVLTSDGKVYQDITYTNMLMSQVNGLHSMYMLTDAKGQVLLPEQIASRLGPSQVTEKDPLKTAIDPLKPDGTKKSLEEKEREYLISVARTRVYPEGRDKSGNTLTSDDDYLNAMRSEGNYSYWKSQFYSEFPSEEDFMLNVAKNYLYSSRIDLETNQDFITEMKKDGNYNYWESVYYQIIGYDDENGTPIKGRGFTTISQENAVDREWLEEAINSGDVQIFKITNDVLKFNENNINIFAETNVATDPDLQEVSNTELIQQVSVEYEKAIKDVDAKETKLDLQLARIDQQHNALKTEYDSVKQIVSKNIERSFKSFNA